MSRSKKKFPAHSRKERLGLLTLIAGAVSVVVRAEWDLQRRPAEEVRGSKTVWRLLCLNAIGAALYLRWGRRTTADL